MSCASSVRTSRCCNAAPNGSNINDDCGSTDPSDLQRAVVAVGCRRRARVRRRRRPPHRGRRDAARSSTATSCSRSRRSTSRSAGSSATTRRRHADGERRAAPHVARRRHRSGRGGSGRPQRARRARRAATSRSAASSRATSSSPTSPPPATACSPARCLLDVLDGTGQRAVGARRHRAAARRRCCRRSPSPTRSSSTPTATSGGPPRRPRTSWATTGRLLVRPSGTEPVVRVMVEAPTWEQAERTADRSRRRRRAGLRDRRAVARTPNSWPRNLDRPCAGSSAWCVGPVGGSLRPGVRSSRSSTPPSGPWWRVGRSPLSALPTGRRVVEGVDGLLRGVPGVLTLLEDRAAGRRHRGPGPPDRRAADGHRARARRARRPGRRARGPQRRRWSGSRTRVWAVQRDRLRTARAVGDLAGAGASTAAHRRVHVDPGRVVGHRPARGAGPRLRRPARRRARPRPRPRRPRRSCGCSKPRLPTRCSRRARCGGRATCSRSCTRPRPRSVSSATTPRRCAPRSATTSCSTSRSPPTRGRRRRSSGTRRWASVGIISEPNAHPLDHSETDREARTRRSCIGALNGDVDNYADLEVAEAARPPRPRSPPTPR